MQFPLLLFSQLALKDLFFPGPKVHGKQIHLDSAVKWLLRAHDQTGQRGVSYGYSARGGWRPAYPETTGYIAVTFFDLAEFLNAEILLSRAIAMCEWEIEVQNDDGSFSNPDFQRRKGIVFDTGQVMFGLLRAYNETGQQTFLDSAIRAGNWLINVAADENGLWTRNTHNGIPHVYNSRAAWALLKLNEIAPCNSKQIVAKSNLDFAVSSMKNGWFRQCAFEENIEPFTHTIAYAIRGLLESSKILSESAYREAAVAVADSCLEKSESDGFIPGQIGIDGHSVSNYCCLTGNVQLAIIWAKIYKINGQDKYKNAAVSALTYVMSRHHPGEQNVSVRGAVKGSFPIWGKYSPLTFPNWPAKFFIDSLLECWDWI